MIASRFTFTGLALVTLAGCSSTPTPTSPSRSGVTAVTTHAAGPPGTVHVDGIGVGWSFSGGGRKPEAFVTIADFAGAPVFGATVTGTFSGCTKGTASGVTEPWSNSCCTTNPSCDPTCASPLAQAYLSKGGYSCQSGKSCCITFYVTGISDGGAHTYDPASNIVTTRSTPGCPRIGGC